MKKFALILSILTMPLMAAPEGCHCENCQCTPENHCGCYSAEGCHCGEGGNPACSGGKQELKDK